MKHIIRRILQRYMKIDVKVNQRKCQVHVTENRLSSSHTEENRCSCSFDANFHLSHAQRHVPFRDLGADYYNHFNREHKINACLKRLSSLGWTPETIPVS